MPLSCWCSPLGVTSLCLAYLDGRMHALVRSQPTGVTSGAVIRAKLRKRAEGLPCLLTCSRMIDGRPTAAPSAICKINMVRCWSQLRPWAPYHWAPCLDRASFWQHANSESQAQAVLCNIGRHACAAEKAIRTERTEWALTCSLSRSIRECTPVRMIHVIPKMQISSTAANAARSSAPDRTVRRLVSATHTSSTRSACVGRSNGLQQAPAGLPAHRNDEISSGAQPPRA